MSAILPFHVRLDGGVLLKYATAQLLTLLRTPEQATYVFFAPEGMHAEFALEPATYQAIEVAGETGRQAQAGNYVVVEPGLDCRVQITAPDGTLVQLLVLTQEQAHSC